MELGTRLDINSFVGEAVCTELGPFVTFMFLVRYVLHRHDEPDDGFQALDVMPFGSIFTALTTSSHIVRREFDRVYSESKVE